MVVGEGDSVTVGERVPVAVTVRLRVTEGVPVAEKDVLSEIEQVAEGVVESGMPNAARNSRRYSNGNTTERAGRMGRARQGIAVAAYSRRQLHRPRGS